MEPEFDEVLEWVEPDAADPDRAASSADSPWGEGIAVAGAVQPLGGKQNPSLMADSYGFRSLEELLRVQKYLKDHGGWQLEQVSCRPKRLVACNSLWSLAIVNCWSLALIVCLCF